MQRNVNHGILIRSILLLLSLSVFAGCDTFQELGVAKKPSVAMSGFSIRSFSLEGINIDATLDVHNTNPVPITLAGYDYQLSINGEQLVAGKQSKATTVAAQKVSQVTIPVALKFSDLKALGSHVLNQDEVKYKLSTTAMLDLPLLGPVPFPVSTSGMLPIPKVPEVSVSGFTVNRIGLTGADVMIGVHVKNPNKFGIDLSNLQGALKVNGATWLNSGFANALKVEPNQAQTVQIPVKLNVMSVGRHMMGLLQASDPLSYQLTGNAVMGTTLPLMKSFNFPFNVSGDMGKQEQ